MIGDWFYIACDGDGTKPGYRSVKVGITSYTIDLRIRSMQGSNPRKIVVLFGLRFIQPGRAYRYEQAFKKVFTSLGWRVRGEWFEVPEAFFNGDLAMADTTKQDAVDILRSWLTSDNDSWMAEIAERFEGPSLITRHSSLITAPEARQ